MKNQTLVTISVVLVLILGVQAYMLFRLNDRVNQLTASNQSNEERSVFKSPNALKPAIPKLLPDDDFFKNQPWNAYEEMQRMQDEMEKIFGDSFSRFHLNTPLGSLSKTPDVDLQDKSDYYLVTVNAPGADASSISVKLQDQMLQISIKTEQAKDASGNDKDDYRYRERFIGEFHRVLSLPGPAEAAKMKTEYRNGVLTITIPKK